MFQRHLELLRQYLKSVYLKYRDQLIKTVPTVYSFINFHQKI